MNIKLGLRKAEQRNQRKFVGTAFRAHNLGGRQKNNGAADRQREREKKREKERKARHPRRVMLREIETTSKDTIDSRERRDGKKDLRATKRVEREERERKN